MTIETKIKSSREMTPAVWTPKARRQGEPAEWPESAKHSEHEDDVIVAPLPPSRLSWPRVFPGL